MAAQSLGSIHMAMGDDAVAPALFWGVFLQGRGNSSCILLLKLYNHMKRTQGTVVSGGIPLHRLRRVS